MPAPRIRLARPEDVPQLPAIEGAASRLFREAGFTLASLELVSSPEDFADGLREGTLWVAADETDRPIGFALVELLDGRPHLEEIDVHPDHGRRGIGAALLRAIYDWARARGHDAITLTTFRDAPWNAPWYARMGFRVVGPDALSPALRAVVAREERDGFPAALRVVMRRALGAQEPDDG